MECCLSHSATLKVESCAREHGFRVFEYDEGPNGALSNPKEITIGGDIVDVEWRVHLGNRKASFFSFYGQVGALDFYVGRSQMPGNAPIKRDGDLPPRANLRNPDVPADDREAKLDIDPGEKVISRSQSAPSSIQIQTRESQ